MTNGRKRNTDAPEVFPGSHLTPIRCIGMTQRSDGKTGEQVWDCMCSCNEIWAARKTQISNGKALMCGKCQKQAAKQRRLAHG